jgi:hypothetical protein
MGSLRAAARLPFHQQQSPDSHYGWTNERGPATDSAYVLSKTKKGACNENVSPLDNYLAVSGTGTVKFG